MTETAIPLLAHTCSGDIGAYVLSKSLLYIKFKSTDSKYLTQFKNLNKKIK